MSDTDTGFPLKKKANSHRKSEEMAKIADLSQIPRLMQCCLCGGIPSPNSVSVCQDGHMICGGCHRKTPEGLCPKDLGRNTEFIELRKICNKKCSTLQCALYSYFFDNSIFNCSYAYLGCAKAKYGRDFVFHRQNCKFRPILPCAFSDCQIRASPMAYPIHLIEVHQIFEVDSDTYRVQVPCPPIDVADSQEIIRRRWVGGLFNCFGLTFILLAEELGQDIYIWIALGSSVNTEGRKFQCRLGFASEKGELTWKGEVYPFKSVYEEDLDAEDIFQIRKLIVARKFVFKVEDQHFWYTDVEIKEVFPEGYIPHPSAPIEMEDMNIQRDDTTTPTPGLTVAEISGYIFEEIPDSEEKLILDSTNSTLEKPRPLRRIGNKGSTELASPIGSKEGSYEFLPTPKPRPKKKDSSDNLQQNGGTGREKIGKSSDNILSNGHSNVEREEQQRDRLG